MANETLSAPARVSAAAVPVPLALPGRATAAPHVRRPARFRPRPSRRDRWGYLFIAPWVIGFLLFTAGPMIASIALSFTDYDMAAARPVGLGNYADLLWRANPVGGHGDPQLYKSLWNTFYYTAFAVPLGLIGSLLLAVLLNQKLRGLSFFRTVYYVPSLVPAVASSLLWIWILQPEKGLLNQFLIWLFAQWPINALHLAPPAWLQSEAWSKPSLIVMSLWGIGGARMVIFLAGLQGIGEQYYEAAKIDGAGPIRTFRHVTLPLITPMIFFNLVLGVIAASQTFTTAYVMTNGGPNDSTLFYALYLYQSAFERLEMGKASAMAWILFTILLVFTLIQFNRSKKWVHYEGEE
ncbi:MAG TPA: sugar ABC transporter permease [Tepidisphaeraceae bacterium]|nr:sugar ABC transporter permease [Tepidisphaeraceae bacterium]